MSSVGWACDRHKDVASSKSSSKGQASKKTSGGKLDAHCGWSEEEKLTLAKTVYDAMVKSGFNSSDWIGRGKIFRRKFHVCRWAPPNFGWSVLGDINTDLSFEASFESARRVLHDTRLFLQRAILQLKNSHEDASKTFQNFEFQCNVFGVCTPQQVEVLLLAKLWRPSSRGP